MKKIISLIAIAVLFIALAAVAQAATTSSNLQINATVPTSALCGNGIIDSGEACDNGANNGPCNNHACSASCTVNSCGGPLLESISIAGVSAAGQCQTGSVTWQVNLVQGTASTPVQSTGYLTYWPTANPGNTTTTNVTANNPQSVSLSGLSPFTSYSYSIHAVYSSYSAEYTGGTFYTGCALSNVA